MTYYFLGKNFRELKQMHGLVRKIPAPLLLSDDSIMSCIKILMSPRTTRFTMAPGTILVVATAASCTTEEKEYTLLCHRMNNLFRKLLVKLYTLEYSEHKEVLIVFQEFTNTAETQFKFVLSHLRKIRSRRIDRRSSSLISRSGRDLSSFYSELARKNSHYD